MLPLTCPFPSATPLLPVVLNCTCMWRMCVLLQLQSDASVQVETKRRATRPSTHLQRRSRCRTLKVASVAPVMSLWLMVPTTWSS